MNFQIKVCGISTIKDAQNACQFGADAIGLNFYSKSLRSVTEDEGIQISKTLKAQESNPFVVGVFVDHSFEETVRIAKQCALDAIQLHGEQTQDFVERLENAASLTTGSKRPDIIRALRCGGLLNDVIESEIHSWRLAGVDGVLLDSAYRAGTQVGQTSPGQQFGGTGHQLEWNQISNLVTRIDPSFPIILAGGLTSENVAEAITKVRPAAVDAASGIESLPGKKDPKLLESFIKNARAAFDNRNA